MNHRERIPGKFFRPRRERPSVGSESLLVARNRAVEKRYTGSHFRGAYTRGARMAYIPKHALRYARRP
jgi:hypothetical protein